MKGVTLSRVPVEGHIHWLLGWLFKGFHQRFQLTAIEGLLLLNKVVTEECSHNRINVDIGIRIGKLNWQQNWFSSSRIVMVSWKGLE